MASETLIKLVAVTAELLGTELSEPGLEMMLADLSAYAEPDVGQALTRCRRECRHRLTLADIVARLPHQPPGPEEAWARAVAARLWEEQTTVVLARAIVEAFPHALWPDRVAARMAFLEVYPGKLREYGTETWVSLGWDRPGRETAVQEAVQQGRLSLAAARRALPGLADDPRLAVAGPGSHDLKEEDPDRRGAMSDE